jgi:hypothetical protein
MDRGARPEYRQGDLSHGSGDELPVDLALAAAADGGRQAIAPPGDPRPPAIGG